MFDQVGDILKGLRGEIAWAVKGCDLLSLWPQVVDERVGRHTTPLKIRNRVLYVLTSSPTWAQELSFLKEALITKFNSLAGEKAISDIRFKVG